MSVLAFASGRPEVFAVVELPVTAQLRNGRHRTHQVGSVHSFGAALAEEVREPYQWHAVGRDHAGLVVNVAQPLVRAGSSLRRGRPRFFTAHIPLPPRHDKIIFFRRPIAPQCTFA